MKTQMLHPVCKFNLQIGRLICEKSLKRRKLILKLRESLKDVEKVKVRRERLTSSRKFNVVRRESLTSS